MNAIGLIETKGLIALVEATDAMARQPTSKLSTCLHRRRVCHDRRARDVGSVRAAVEAGAAAATSVGELVSSHIIPRPADGLVAAYLS